MKKIIKTIFFLVLITAANLANASDFGNRIVRACINSDTIMPINQADIAEWNGGHITGSGWKGNYSVSFTFSNSDKGLCLFTDQVRPNPPYFKCVTRTGDRLNIISCSGVN